MAANDPKPCKCCGTCPTCGHRPVPVGTYPWPVYPPSYPWPYGRIYPNPQPYWVNPHITYQSHTVGISQAAAQQSPAAQVFGQAQTNQGASLSVAATSGAGMAWN